MAFHHTSGEVVASTLPTRPLFDRGVQDSVLRPPRSGATPAEVLPPLTRYVVLPGDNVTTIAARAGIEVATLIQVNHLTSGDDLATGEVLVVPPVDGAMITPADGQTLDELARAYSVAPATLRQVNGLDPAAPLPIAVFVPGASSAAPLRRPVPVPPTASRPGLLQFVWPAQGTITQPFLPYHPGIDIANSYGTPEVAAAGGKVVWAGWGSYGIYVEIDHGHGLRTIYGHMERVLVTVGQTVSVGQEVGLMGATGRATGPHLHFQVELNGVPQNPLNFLST